MVEDCEPESAARGDDSAGASGLEEAIERIEVRIYFSLIGLNVSIRAGYAYLDRHRLHHPETPSCQYRMDRSNRRNLYKCHRATGIFQVNESVRPSHPGRTKRLGFFGVHDRRDPEISKGDTRVACNIRSWAFHHFWIWSGTPA
jgi:hypothetical protein